jgi:predicted Zn-dependent peptidase
MYFGRHISMDEIAQRVDAVQPDDVLTVARELFTPERIGLTVLGPIDGLKVSRADLVC